MGGGFGGSVLALFGRGDAADDATSSSRRPRAVVQPPPRWPDARAAPLQARRHRLLLTSPPCCSRRRRAPTPRRTARLDWLPRDEWVMSSGCLTRRAVHAVHSDRAEVDAWLDDHRARPAGTQRGWSSQRKLARARRAADEVRAPGDARCLERRALETLTQGLPTTCLPRLPPAIADHARRSACVRRLPSLRDSGLVADDDRAAGRPALAPRRARGAAEGAASAAWLGAMSRHRPGALQRADGALPAFMRHTYRTPSQQVSCCAGRAAGEGEGSGRRGRSRRPGALARFPDQPVRVAGADHSTPDTAPSMRQWRAQANDTRRRPAASAPSSAACLPRPPRHRRGRVGFLAARDANIVLSDQH